MISRENVGTKSEILEMWESKDTTKQKKSPLPYLGPMNHEQGANMSSGGTIREELMQHNIQGPSHKTPSRILREAAQALYPLRTSDACPFPGATTSSAAA